MVKTILMIKSDYLKFIKRQEVVGKPIIDKLGKLNNFYLPLSEWIYSIYKKDKKTKIIGLIRRSRSGKKYYYRNFETYFKKKIWIKFVFFQ